MNPIVCNVAAFAVVLLYGLYRTHQHVLARKQRLLRQRVAYMLWVMAEHFDSEPFAQAH